MFTKEEAQKFVSETLETHKEHLDREWYNKNIANLFNGWGYTDELYVPDQALVDLIEKYKNWRNKSINLTKDDVGKLMEEIALLSLKCLKGWDSVKSYQSYAAQIDLVISGSGKEWVMIMDYLHLNSKFRSIAVEAKNLDGKVDDKQFSRFCYHIDNSFENTVQIGIFFTNHGATGFPKRSTTNKGVSRENCLRSSQATQILFFAKKNKFVIVLDDRDIFNLCKAGSLLRILEEKIRFVEQWAGLIIEPDSNNADAIVVDLPPHLAKHM